RGAGQAAQDLCAFGRAIRQRLDQYVHALDIALGKRLEVGRILFQIGRLAVQIGFQRTNRGGGLVVHLVPGTDLIVDALPGFVFGVLVCLLHIGQCAFDIGGAVRDGLIGVCQLVLDLLDVFDLLCVAVQHAL